MGQESDIIRWDGAGHVYFFSLTGGNDGADTGLPNNRFLTFDTVTEDAKGNAQYTPKQDGPGFDANIMPVYLLNSLSRAWNLAICRDGLRRTLGLRLAAAAAERGRIKYAVINWTSFRKGAGVTPPLRIRQSRVIEKTAKRSYPLTDTRSSRYFIRT